MACFLGILHHQRPGFLSFPSSHLVPYLRDKKYPSALFPEMYAYRGLRSRLLAKINRCFKRFTRPRQSGVTFVQSAVQNLDFPKRFDALITSPPYMNALDYGRDNRLRLWFIDPNLTDGVDNGVTQRRNGFKEAIVRVAEEVDLRLRRGGFCVFIVGQELHRSFDAHPSEVILEIISRQTRSLRLRRLLISYS